LKSSNRKCGAVKNGKIPVLLNQRRNNPQNGHIAQTYRTDPISGKKRGYIAEMWINPNSIKAHYQSTFVHEFGHIIDCVLTDDYFPSKQTNGIFSDVMNAITNSKHYNDISDFKRRAKARVHNLNYLKYYNDKTEWFARAFAQYVGVKMEKENLSGGDIIIKEIRETIKINKNKGTPFLYQWEDRDFEPIFKAFDDTFGRMGFLK